MGRTVIRVWDGLDLSGSERDMIINTRQRALEIQRLVEADVSEIWSTRRRRRLARIADFPRVRRWIGMQSRHVKVRRVNRRVRKLRRWLENRRIIIVVRSNDSLPFSGASGRRGYSRGPRFISPVIRFHISQRWFTADGSDDSRAALFIHELCHEMGMPHGKSDNDTVCEIVANALTDPNRVIKNPVMYQGLFLEYSDHPIVCPNDDTSTPIDGEQIFDGRYMFVFALGDDGDMYYKYRDEESGDWSSSWTSRGSPNDVSLIGSPTLVTNGQHMFIFALSDDGNMYYKYRDEQSGDWSSSWTSRGSPGDVLFVGSPSLVTDGQHMFVFALGDDGNMYYKYRDEESGEWSPSWTSRKSPNNVLLVGAPSLISDGRYMFVFAVGDDGNMYYQYRDEESGDWSSVWISRGAPNGTPFVGSPSLVADGQHLFVFGLGDDGNMYYKYRDEGSGDWSSSWTSRGSPNGASLIGSPALVSDGRHLFVFGLGDDGNMYYKYRDEESGSWSRSWVARRAPDGVSLIGSPSPISDDGYMFVFALGDDGNMYYSYRDEDLGDWSLSWTSRSSPNDVSLVSA